METAATIKNVLDKIPHREPFRFIEKITYLDVDRIEGTYLLKEDADFYRGHFPGYAVTPGVILTEIMAQTGMVAFGIYLMMLAGEKEFRNMFTFLTENNIKFKKAVLPGETVFITAEKIIFRHGKLECKVELKNQQQELVCYGTMGGMLVIKKENG